MERSRDKSSEILAMREIEELQKQLEAAVVWGAQKGDMSQVWPIKREFESKYEEIKERVGPLGHLSPELRLLLKKESVWTKRLTVGGKNRLELMTGLSLNQVKVGHLAEQMMESDFFETVELAVEMDFVSLAVGDLGFEDEVTNREIYRRAGELGLALCPMSVAPELISEGTDWLPVNELSSLGMKPISIQNNDLAFIIGFDGRSRCLLAQVAEVDFLMPKYRRMIFRLPTRDEI